MVSLENRQVVINKRGVERLRRGHLWVYWSDIVKEKRADAGAVVEVCDERGTILGKAFFSSKSQISLRLLTRGDVPIDNAFFARRFSEADDLRERLNVDPVLSRRIFAEGDLLPGLMIDRYADRIVVQNLIQAADRIQPVITRILQERYLSLCRRREKKIER